MAEELRPIQTAHSRNTLFANEGEKLLLEGRVGAVVLAGGQGTRLGIQGPKGTFPISAIQKKSLFQLLSEKALFASQKYGKTLPLAVMTSADNALETKQFFASHNNFGLETSPQNRGPSPLSFFSQTTLPLLDNHLKPYKNLYASDGNGSFFWAFKQSGILDAWQSQGIEYITIFVVDNPLINPFDPDLIGLTALSKGEVSLVAIERLSPQEKVGLLVQQKGKVAVIEYNELPETVAQQPSSFLANISFFCMSTSFITKIAAMSKALFPLHNSIKKQLHIETPLIKQEYFIFDMLSCSNRTEVLCLKRNECFAPLKNKEGNDSPTTCREAIMHYERALFRAITHTPVRDSQIIELSPSFYYPTETLRKRWDRKNIPQDGYAF
jgi:UDP-N-acetylglucosamine/UDP-N-acetylgalactosamine diphosphorylase